MMYFYEDPISLLHSSEREKELKETEESGNKFETGVCPSILWIEKEKKRK